MELVVVVVVVVCNGVARGEKRGKTGRVGLYCLARNSTSQCGPCADSYGSMPRPCSAAQCSAVQAVAVAGLGWASLSPSPSPSPSPLPEQQHMASCSPLVNPGDVSPALAPPVQPPATLNSIVLYTHTYEQKEEEEEEEEAPRPLTRNLGPGCKILHSLAHPSIHPPIHPRLSHPNVFMPCSQAACTPLTTPMHLAKARIQPFSLHWPSPVAPLFPAPPVRSRNNSSCAVAPNPVVTSTLLYRSK
ncbi:hypothetical protein BKA81DRAFT_149597 [Phyllosticta paracitricarpa]|uniref:Uncharacterized protein n=1 Tax=Phyllosticta paracitricarpa TaxID=2016321 RepID=A0ABR1NJT1_9PEZI